MALIGREDEVTAGLDKLAAAGPTDLAAAIFAPRGEDPARTRSLLETYARASAGR